MSEPTDMENFLMQYILVQEAGAKSRTDAIREAAVQCGETFSKMK